MNDDQGSAPRPSRWRHVPLGGLFEAYGNVVAEKGRTLQTGHLPAHASKSGTCVTIYPEAGRWRCSSCREAGDAATFLMSAEGLTYRQAESQLIARFGRPAEDLPTIVVNGRQLRELSRDALDALARANDPPRIFTRERQLARLVPSTGGRLAVEPLVPQSVRNELSLAADFVRLSQDRKSGEEIRTPVMPPTVLADDVLAQSGWEFPALRGVVDRPTLRADGSLLAAPGYDARSGIYLDPAAGLRIAELPERPTAAQVKRALELVETPIREFPFSDGRTDRAAALALGFLPFVREMVDGPTPLHMLEAPSPGAGKGLLAAALTVPGCGDGAHLVAVSRADDEMRKMLLGVLQGGAPAALFDNVNHTLDSAALCAVLTAYPSWSDRELGANPIVTVPVRTVWIATANNPVLSLEMARRTIRCRLDPKVERAWQRAGFAITRLKAWVDTHRAALIAAYLTLARSWVVAGQPAWSGTPLGSFERWSEVVGGILEHIGVGGFLGNLEAFYETADTETAARRRLVASWWERYQSAEVGAADLFVIALGIDELVLRGNNERAQRTSFGMLLGKLRDVTIGGFRIVSTGRQHQAGRWQLLPMTPPVASEPREPSEPSILAREKTERTFTGDRGVQGSLGSLGPPDRAAPITDGGDARAAVAALVSATVIGIDIETAGPGERGALDPRAGWTRLVQLATADGVTLIDLAEVDPLVLAPLFHPTEGPILVGHNLRFDLSFLVEAGLEIPNGVRLFDTMIASQVLGAAADERPRGYHSLSSVAERYLAVTLDKTEQASDWSGPLSDEQLAYAAADAAILPRLYAALTAELGPAGLARVAALEMRCLPAVCWLERTGAPFDQEAWTALGEKAAAAVAAVDAQLHELVPEILDKKGKPKPVNWASVQQVKAILEARGHTIANVGEAALAELAEAEPVARLLLDRRAASKRAGTYGSSYVSKHVSPKTGRIHASWNQLRSRAGRMSCSGPNLQQIPRDRLYRACVRPPSGRCFVKGDYSQIELRVAAEISGDARLLAAYQDGQDVHALTAATVLGRENGAVTADDRQSAKAVNFGFVFGMGPATFKKYAAASYGVQLTDEAAVTFRARFFQTYPGLKAWHRQQPSKDWDTGEPIAIDTRTLAGRRRSGVVKFTEKLNSPVQGTAADGLKGALALLWETRASCPSAVPVLAIHDEIVVECDVADVATAKAWLVACMVRGMSTFVRHVPIVVDATVERDWSGTPLEEAQA